MAYKKSAYRILKDKVKTVLAGIAKKNPRFKTIYAGSLDSKRHRRYLKYANLPIDDKAIIFESFMAKRYADSPRAIYEYMLNSPEYKDYKFYWTFRATIMDAYMWLNDNDRTTVVQYGNEDYYKLFATAKYWVVNSRIIDAIDVRPEQVYLQCWHGTPLKRLGFDIEVQGDNAKHTKEDLCRHYAIDAKKYTNMVSPSAFCTEKFTSAFGLDQIGRQDIIIEEGYPRNDFLVNYTSDDVARVRKALGVPDDKKLILYAPTWRDNQHVAGTGYVFDNPLDFDKMKEELGDEYVILFRPHYFVANAFDFSKYEGWVYDVANYPDINDLYIVSDILITDYSSVFFDYSILKRPILFYMYDLKYYQDTVRGFYISLDELPGPIVEEQDELFSRLKTVDEWTDSKDYKNKYQTFSDKFTYLDDGHAAERVARKVFR